MSKELTNSKRVLHSASYVVAELTPREQREMAERPSRGVEKLNLLRRLNPTHQELERLHAMAERRDDLAPVIGLGYELAREENSGRWNLGLAKEAARLAPDTLIDFGLMLSELRGTAWAEAAAFQQRMRTAPVGRLHLERIEMYPSGVEQGELVFTVPLAPKETVTISHKEWSLSGEEYERIVQDYFESYSERGVAEKTDFSMSAENETRHSNALSLSSTVSGGYGPVYMSVTAGLTASAEDREAVKSSAQRSREVTEKASARTRQEHKVSAKLETKRGAEEASYRTITNPHEDKALRLDYYRMMRKWRVDLYRYGLRLTYDIPIPNPGARLWAKHMEVKALDTQLSEPFRFDLTPGGVTDSSYDNLADAYGVALEAPPAASVNIMVSKTIIANQETEALFEFVAPPGYELRPLVRGVIHYWGPAGQPELQFSDANPNKVLHPNSGLGSGAYDIELYTIAGDPNATSPRSAVTLIKQAEYTIIVTLVATADRKPEAFEAWRFKAWNALREATLAQHNQGLALLQARRDRLWSQLSGADTLSLRRMEREELIRLALLWMIGPSFDATPEDVGQVIRRMLDREQSDLPDDWPGASMFGKLLAKDWAIAQGFGEYVKFLHHAVEWENLLYFLYPYFWGSDDLAREKLLFEHPDSNHRDFLRAGYARVVVPVRPGFENDFTKLLETGIFAGTDTSPYLTIAEEVAAYARTNYQGIPPANPEKHTRPLLYPEQRKTWETMQKVLDLIETHHEDNGSYPANLSVLSGGPFKDAWGRDLVYKNPGSGNEYDLISYGKDGVESGEELDADISAAASASLVATWFDYTPTSGIDIELTGKPIVP
jgi:hypothetical protein